CGARSASITPGVAASARASGCCRSQTTSSHISTACDNAALTGPRTVTWTEDTTKPVIVASGTTLTLGCNPSAADIGAALGSATYTDNCGPLTATSLAGVDGTVSSSGCSRSQTRTWNVSDVCGNAALTVSRTVTWKEDTTKPVFSGLPPAAATAECYLDAPAAPLVTATDNCDGNVTVNDAEQQSNPGSSSNTSSRTW